VYWISGWYIEEFLGDKAMKTFKEMTSEEAKAFTEEFIDNLDDKEWDALLEETGFAFYNNVESAYLDKKFRPVYPIYETEMDTCFYTTTALISYKAEMKNLTYEYKINIFETSLTACADNYGYALAA
jgi:hypothetical protein